MRPWQGHRAAGGIDRRDQIAIRGLVCLDE
jgi:hypothetical protein